MSGDRLVPRLLTAIIIVLLALPTGCATNSYAPATTAAAHGVEIRVDDKVRVVTTRRERLSLRITEIRSDRFVGVRSGHFQKVTSDPFARLASRPSPEDDPRQMSMNVRTRVGTVALLALMPAACYTPSLKTPTLSPLSADEKTMDCAQLDLALDRADTVRWLIRDDGGRLETAPSALRGMPAT
jgi:hypothetical protein